MKYSQESIYRFLCEIDDFFVPPLSEKQELLSFSKKIYLKATVCAEVVDSRIVSAVIGYTDNLIDNSAYISVVATLVDHYGHGYASKLINQFVDICSEKKIDSVHLYTTKNNIKAQRMYERLEFVRFFPENEQRRNDIHYIKYLGRR